AQLNRLAVGGLGLLRVPLLRQQHAKVGGGLSAAQLSRLTQHRCPLRAATLRQQNAEIEHSPYVPELSGLAEGILGSLPVALALQQHTEVRRTLAAAQLRRLAESRTGALSVTLFPQHHAEVRCTAAAAQLDRLAPCRRRSH